ncbi:zinc-binding metallopeptidase family protein [Clostridium sp. DL1XJH146]
MIDLLNRLVKEFGVSTKEQNIKNIIKNEIEDILKESSIKWWIKEDITDNLILKIGKGSRKIMLTTHMDSIGLMITSIDEGGFAKVMPIGNYKVQSYIGEIIEFENNIIGRICSVKENPTSKDLFVDFVISTKEELEKYIRPGSIGKINGTVYNKNERILSPNLSSRTGVLVFLEIIKDLSQNIDFCNEIYFVFSSRKQLASSGARTAAFDIMPHGCIVLDTIEADDYLGGEGKVKLGRGPVVSIYDRSLIIHHEIKETLDEISENKKVKIQYNIGIDTNEGGIIHKEAGGIKTGLIAIPCRYSNTSKEICNLNDIMSTITILSEFLVKY